MKKDTQKENLKTLLKDHLSLKIEMDSHYMTIIVKFDDTYICDAFVCLSCLKEKENYPD